MAKAYGGDAAFAAAISICAQFCHIWYMRRQFKYSERKYAFRIFFFFRRQVLNAKQCRAGGKKERLLVYQYAVVVRQQFYLPAKQSNGLQSFCQSARRNSLRKGGVLPYAIYDGFLKEIYESSL
ncbi:hypothetical protein NPIL_1551 [Nephila pilipes]|uniref:Uncharacterized protein n=1 Tax=Nephila pilipes TaxID=299642 RepID=A0A8X6TBN2_NEPPI|nr:hypothetical protein NPIL_1551 [Nephila pilipes]